ncbi:MAG: hypothetical protein SH820_11365 [Xanthomonadales bacterium]|nr:hypothetical protein [Xanthomonadales bacterium]
MSRTFRIPKSLLTLALLVTVSCSPVVAAEQKAINPIDYQAMEWRLLGPFRGGRVTAVAGHADQPYTYYQGATGGGVWKTEDAGLNWQNISDGYFKTGTIGALAVAPSDANIIYAGTGESPVRGVSTSHGDGVYKSTDAGKTWVHLGLEETRQISKIVVDPANADVVYIGAQGNPWGPSDERGVYKSTDGGQNWSKVLFVNPTTGASFLSIDPNNPETVYVGMWDHQRLPWKIRSGGPGSSLWKTTDGGSNWTKLTQGLPEIMGNTGITVSPANPDRVYAMIEATEGGIFRSDDGGMSWTLVNSDNGIRDRGWYYTHIFAHPADENMVYVLAASMVVSTDGGETFEGIQTPHGDNHDLWINPQNPNLMVEGNDGGANVSWNAGKSWTTQSNQPTGQFYRVVTDNMTPYRLYSGQQDNSSIRIASSAVDGGIGEEDWRAVGGGESSTFGFDRDNPRLVYGTGLLGGITEYDDATGLVRRIDAYPFFAGFRSGEELKYRFNWNAPVLVSQHDPKVIYHGAQMVLKSADQGLNWAELSPDLTRNNNATLGTTGGPIQIEGAGGEHYATIMYLAESPHDAKVLWAGSDDGLIHVTRDGGKNWSNVTPKGMPEGQINTIDVSPHDPASVYVAMTRYKLNEFKPFMYKTNDYGKSWKLITRGIPADTFARVVREDSVRRGLLYAGTEAGPFVSFDDGSQWLPLQLNLPIVPITDLQVHGNDLVAATQGRAFWILDGLEPLRQLGLQKSGQEVVVFAPGDAVRANEGWGRGDQGKNPPYGAMIYYSLDEIPEGEVTLRILDENNELVREFTNVSEGAEKQGFVKGVRGEPPAKALPMEVGQNRYQWNLRTQPMIEVADTIIYVSTRPYRAAPGSYTVEFNAGGKTVRQPLQVVPYTLLNEAPVEDPLWIESATLLNELTVLVNDIHRSTNQMRAIANQAKELSTPDESGEAPTTLSSQATALLQRAQQWEIHMPQPPLPGGVEDRISIPSRLLSTQVLHLMDIVDQGPPVSSAAIEQAQEFQQKWSSIKTEMDEILSTDVQELNEILRTQGLEPVQVPDGLQPVPRVK